MSNLRLLCCFVWPLLGAAGLTQRGWVNPLKYLNQDTLAIHGFDIAGAESEQDVHGNLLKYASNQNAFMDGVEERNPRRVGIHRCDQSLVNTQDILPTMHRLESAGYFLSGLYLNIGAGDGEEDDPIMGYARAANASGVAIEQDPIKCDAHQRSFPNVRVACSAVTPGNVLELVGDLVTTPATFLDVVKIDIDSYDCAVAEVLLSKIPALVVVLETNPSVPPPYQWTMLYDPRLWELFGSLESLEHVPCRSCSLSYEVEMMRRFGYDLIFFGGHDAVFAHKSVRAAWAPVEVPLDEVDCFHAAFIVANGIPLSLTRRWFYEVDTVHEGISDMFNFFADWMTTHFGRVLPFALRAA